MNIKQIFNGNVSKLLLQDITTWVTNYINSYSDPDPSCQENYDIKRIHTFKVRDEIEFLGNELGLKEDALRLAEIIGLLHDIGRFEQYSRYKTYKDSISENHATLGIKILHDHKVLDAFDDLSKSIIINAISFHNRFAIPKTETNPHLFYDKLIRDADKLDIWRVVIAYYYRNDNKINKEIEWNSNPSTLVSKEVLEDIYNKQAVLIKHVQSMNDFKVLQMAWVLDLNFKITQQEVKNRKYLEKLYKSLPQNKEIDDIYNFLITQSMDK